MINNLENIKEEIFNSLNSYFDFSIEDDKFLIKNEIFLEISRCDNDLYIATIFLNNKSDILKLVGTVSKAFCMFVDKKDKCFLVLSVFDKNLAAPLISLCYKTLFDKEAVKYYSFNTIENKAVYCAIKNMTDIEIEKNKKYLNEEI